MLTQQQRRETLTTSSSVELVGIPNYWVDLVWNEAAPLIEKAIPYAETPYTLEQIHSGILDRTFQLWLIKEGSELLAAGVTQITDTHCWIYAIGGRDCRKWLHTLELIKQWSGKPIAYAGRKGWKRLLRA